MARYFHLLETRNRFANDDLWRGHARGAACVRGRGGTSRVALVAGEGAARVTGSDEMAASLGA
ncbi:MAG: hypothetical protein C4B59_11785 [Candidatus Methanogaster sp.]|uniref:Uncharacterized protein n=1 Tax=Candidatus Methanogaster sp. TaxID=3386292 RepID=A0AC61L125_9EURY|nr:MAG: hypothetical protein C4B59_11785 [ANME-2 cluster archaeon]